MSTTLTNGLKLPDKGSVDWYADMQNNYTILDGAVGTVAEHTSALAGKAPAVHTHTKTDITDLFNSNFIPSANNSYDLGSSSYQWNNLYAKNYYYNGTAWGLDKTNVWTQSQTIKNTEYQIGETPSAAKASYINFTDKNNVNIGWIQRRIEASGDSSIELFVYNRFTNSQPDPAGTTDYAMLKVGLKSDQTHFCEITGDAYPRNNNAYNLGTSTTKWKTLNGINPGALSLPNYDDTTYIDISGSIVPPSGETEINKNLGDNYYTPPVDGWLSIRCDGAKYLQIYRNAYNTPGVTAGDGTVGIKLVVTLPVRKNVTYTIKIKKDQGAGTEFYQLYPCLGNV